MQPLLEARALVKDFAHIRAVDGVSFSVEPGAVMGFLGPNGAGKSTTMKMLTGFLRPTAGEAFIAGHSVEGAPIAAKRRLGYLPEGAPAYGDMTPLSFLTFTARARGMADVAGAVRRAVAATHLWSVAEQPIDTLSKGFKRRVGLAQAILHDPDVLVLDEPTDGLDPNQKHEVRSLIRDMAAAKAIIISTHILEEVDAVCSRAVIIDRGRIVADGTPASLRARSRYHNAVAVTVAANDAAAARAVITDVDDVVEVEVAESGAAAVITALAKDGRPIIGALTGRLEDKGIRMMEIAVDPGRLDDVFRTLTTSEAGSDATQEAA